MEILVGVGNLDEPCSVVLLFSRHCGRLLCSKCSDKDIPIIKYNIPKPVRVCEMCFDVLTLGLAAST